MSSKTSEEITDFDQEEFKFLRTIAKYYVLLPDDPIPYPTVEHAFQASKTNDLKMRAQIRGARNGIEAKRIGSRVELSEEWRENSLIIMERLLRDKFIRHKELRQILKNTGNKRIIYRNDHNDKFWGESKGEGSNHLGLLIEKIRQDIKSENDLSNWVKLFFDLCPAKSVMIGIQVKKNGHILRESSQRLTEKNIIRFGKLPLHNDIEMAHPTISRSHAILIICNGPKLFLIDLFTGNGSFINGEKIPSFTPVVVLENETVMTFGCSERQYTVSNLDIDFEETKKQDLIKRVSDLSQYNESDDRETTVFIGNLSEEVNEQNLIEFFSPCGEIKEVILPKSKKNDSNKTNFAFVKFVNESSLLQALTLDQDLLCGRAVRVKRSSGGTGRKSAPSSKKPESSTTNQIREQRHESKDGYERREYKRNENKFEPKKHYERKRSRSDSREKKKRKRSFSR